MADTTLERCFNPGFLTRAHAEYFLLLHVFRFDSASFAALVVGKSAALIRRSLGFVRLT
jgi:hypothetical protein